VVSVGDDGDRASPVEHRAGEADEVGVPPQGHDVPVARLIAVAGRAVEQRGTVVLVEPLQLGLHVEHAAGQDHPVGHE